MRLSPQFCRVCWIVVRLRLHGIIMNATLISIALSPRIHSRHHKPKCLSYSGNIPRQSSALKDASAAAQRRMRVSFRFLRFPSALQHASQPPRRNSRDFTRWDCTRRYLVTDTSLCRTPPAIHQAPAVSNSAETTNPSVVRAEDLARTRRLVNNQWPRSHQRCASASAPPSEVAASSIYMNTSRLKFSPRAASPCPGASPRRASRNASKPRNS